MKTDLAQLEERTRAILAINPNYRPHYYVPPGEVLAVLTALQEAHKALRRVELAQDCEHCAALAGETLDGIAEKVDL